MAISALQYPARVGGRGQNWGRKWDCYARIFAPSLTSSATNQPTMYFGADYYPEHWVYPFDGTAEEPESRWEQDAQLMAHAGMNVVRMGEFCWGLCEREEGKFDFTWLRRAMDAFSRHGVRIVLSTPTAAPPVWLAQKHPEILPIDENGQPRREGTRRAYCMNSDVYWEHAKKVVRAMAEALGDHPDLVAWQIDNGVGRHNTEYAFNPETKRDWHAWLKSKYETVDLLNERMGLRFWGQVVNKHEEVPMPLPAPAVHNPALITDWRRFSSDTCVAFIRMQADLLREITPKTPVTTTIRPYAVQIDHFDLADAIDFVAMDSDAAVGHKSAENAMTIDIARSLKKGGEAEGFWVMEQKAGNVAWAEANSLVRPGVVRLFSYQLLSRGATGLLYFYWRMPRIGPEKFYGGVLTHDGLAKNRMFQEVMQVGTELQTLTPMLAGTQVQADVAILVSHPSDWALNQPMRPNKFFSQREHVQLFYSALHDRNILVDFARPTDDLAKYKLVIAPSLHMIAGGEADMLRLYVHNGGTLVGTFNTGLVDENHIAATDPPYEMSDMFGLKVLEFDPLPPGEENHITIKGSFPTTGLHSARLWCDIIEPMEGCQVLGTYAQDFYAGKPAVTMNQFGEGRAIYVGTMSSLPFYHDLITWLRQICGIAPLLRVPDQVEVSMRARGDYRIYFLLNHHAQNVHVQFFKPVRDCLTGKTISGGYDIPPKDILVVDEQAAPA
jgi:beta-galactosidase